VTRKTACNDCFQTICISVWTNSCPTYSIQLNISKTPFGTDIQTQNFELKIQNSRQTTEKKQNAYFNLFYPWTLEPQVKAVVAEAAYFRMVSVIAHADNWDLALLYQLDQLLHRETTALYSLNIAWLLRTQHN